MGWKALSYRTETPPIARGGWLDALRFIVAVLIILHHFQAAGPVPLAQAIHPVFKEGGFLLTNFFLIDSGYVLMRIYGYDVSRGRMTGSDFFLKRFLRVYPGHLIMLTVLVTAVLLSEAAGVPPRAPEWFRWDQLFAQFTLTQSLGVPGGIGWNAATWSVSALIGCYLAFPYVLRILISLKPWTALFGMAAVYLIANQLTWVFLDSPIYQMPMVYGLIRALPLFALGMTLAVFSERVWVNPRLAGWTMLLAFLGLATAQYFGKNALISLFLISLIILGAGAIPVTKPSKFVERAAIVSYAMFVSNEVVRIIYFGFANVAIARFDLNVSLQWALWFAGFVLAIVFAFVFSDLVDQPIQNKIKAWLKTRRKAVATPREPVAPSIAADQPSHI
ncbi:MAG: acyltransferase [Caulobacterales bacterium]